MMIVNPPPAEKVLTKRLVILIAAQVVELVILVDLLFRVYR